MWDLKKLMLAVQGGLCFYCWKPMSADPVHKAAGHHATKDHLLPISQGGAADWTNTVLACLACNRAKANRLPTQAERARHGHVYALFNERVEIRTAEIAAREASKASVIEVAELESKPCSDQAQAASPTQDESPVQDVPPTQGESPVQHESSEEALHA